MCTYLVPCTRYVLVQGTRTMYLLSPAPSLLPSAPTPTPTIII